MKKVCSLILLALICTTGMFAQKFGHVNTQDIVVSMPETKSMEKTITDKAKELESTMETLYKEYEQKAVDIQTNGESMTQAIRDAKIQEISALEQRITTFQQNAQTEIGELEQKLTQPILEKAKKAIQQVAKQNGYTYIFDVSSGTVLVAPEEHDLTHKVKKALGL